MESLIKSVLDNDLATLQTYFDDKIQEKVNARIESAKVDVLAKLNNCSRDQMLEIMNVSKA